MPVRIAKPQSNMLPRLPKYLPPLRGMPTRWQLSAVSHGPLWLCASERRLQTGRVESRQKFCALLANWHIHARGQAL